ncbi:MAG: ABC transporter ATP-binding protein [Clostridiales bacterium]|nr:ABC transporter ATP-binding protein [Clostridiales bacterium]
MRKRKRLNPELKAKREKRREKYRDYVGGRRKPGERADDIKGTARRYFSLLLPHKKAMTLVVFAGGIGAATSIAGPRLLGQVVDAIQNEVNQKLIGLEMDFRSILTLMLLLLAVYGTSSVLNFVQHFTMAGVTQRVVFSLRQKVNSKLTLLPLKFFDTYSKGDILSRVVNDIDNISNSFQHSIIQVLTSFVTAVGMFIGMLYISWRLTLITLAILPPSLLLALFITRYSRKLFKNQWDRTGELNGHVEEMFTGHNIVKVFGREKDSMDEFEDINNQLAGISRKAQFVSGLVGPTLDFFGYVAFIMICVFGGMFVVGGRMSLGGITSFYTYALLFMQPIVSLGNITNRMQSSLACAERVFHLLDEEEESPDDNKNFIENPQGNVCFDDVDFSYKPDEPLIENMNIKVKPGQLIAIVGPTGGGKTTLVNLLMRFYEVDAGSISVDGIDIRTIPRSNLRSIFGMVLQDTWLFKGTIRENIAYGKEDASEEEILAAADAARVTHFIQTLPDGLDTMLEEDGANISQGQRQLLTIARAILADPAILILDEATSSVDTRTEVLIQQAMKTLMKDRTNFVIAHRLSTIREADRILVINHGQIIEQGKHEELLDEKGFYAELYRSQFGFYESSSQSDS